MNFLCINRKYKEETLMNIRRALLKDYLNELQTTYDIPPLSEVMENDAYHEYMLQQKDNMEWIDIYANDGNKPIGFVMIASEPCYHPDVDYYIAEAYISPEFRRQGLMTTTVSEFINAHDGIYSLFVIKDNLKANSFWTRLFVNHGYGPYTLTDVGIKADYCDELAFKKEENTCKSQLG